MLKHLDKEGEDNETTNKTQRISSVERSQKDYESFLNDLEEDPDMRQHINLYKVAHYEQSMIDAEEDKLSDYPDIPIEELLEQLQLEEENEG